MLLDGIRVLDLGRYLAAPLCATVLADYGAEVIRVERPGGAEDREQGPKTRSGENVRFLMVSRNKQGITLNLDDPRGLELLRRLITHCDVLVENFSREVRQRLGLTYQDLCRVNPRLVVATVSGFGDEGPYSHRLAMDPIVQAECGSMSFSGHPDSPPIRSQVPWVDLSTGLYAALGTIMALWDRERTGKGQHVDTALFDTAVSYLGFYGPPAEYQALGLLRPRLGNAGYHTFIDLFTTRDGEDVIVAAVSNPLWRRLARLIGRQDLLEDPRLQDDSSRYEHHHLVREAIQPWVESRTLEEVMEETGKAGVLCGRVSTMAEVISHPQVRFRDLLTPLDVPQAGPLLHPRLGVRLSDLPSRLKSPAPRAGEHNDEVYTRLLGVSAEALAELRQGGVI